MADSTYIWTSWNSSSTCTSTTCSTNDAWVAWNYSTDATISGNSNGEVWYYWTTDITTDSYINVPARYDCNDVAWTNWHVEPESIRIIEGDFSTPYVDKRRERLKAKRAERRRLKTSRKNRARIAMRELELRRAEEKAKELLLDLIGPEQMEVYERTGRVFVKGREYDWLLETSHPTNRCEVKKIKKDKVIDLCIHIADDTIPKTDQLVGYLLHAKHNEEHLDKEANNQGVMDIKDFQDRIKDAANV